MTKTMGGRNMDWIYCDEKNKKDESEIVVEVNTRMNGGSWDEEECNDKIF